MPRIISIARSSPTRSSVVRCSDTSAGTAALWAVSVAIRRALSLFDVVQGPGSAGLASAVSRGLRGARCDAARVGHRGVTLEAMHASGQVERVWIRRLRWRMRGAWQWPAFGLLTVVDAVLLTELPFYEEGPGSLVAGLLVAGFANLFAVAVIGPLLGLRLRRRRPDLPRLIAADYASTAVLALICAGFLAGGLLHRPAVAADREELATVVASTH